METITIFSSSYALGNPGPSAIGIRMHDAQGNAIKEVSETIGNASADFSEYLALLRGLQVAKEHFGDNTKELHFELKLVSEFVKKQLNAEIEIKEPSLVPYYIEIHNMRVNSFPNLSYILITLEQNKEARTLAEQALA